MAGRLRLPTHRFPEKPWFSDKAKKSAQALPVLTFYLMKVIMDADIFQVSTQNQIEAQRSGFDLERRSDGMSER
jgi:hypothetical protein